MGVARGRPQCVGSTPKPDQRVDSASVPARRPRPTRSTCLGSEAERRSNPPPVKRGTPARADALICRDESDAVVTRHRRLGFPGGVGNTQMLDHQDFDSLSEDVKDRSSAPTTMTRGSLPAIGRTRRSAPRGPTSTSGATAACWPDVHLCLVESGRSPTTGDFKPFRGHRHAPDPQSQQLRPPLHSRRPVPSSKG